MAADEEAADDQETTAAVCLALDLSSMVQTLEEGVQLWGQTLGQAGALTIKPISATVDTPRPAPQPAAAAAAAAALTGRQRSKDRAATSSQAAAATAAAAAAARYVSDMQPFRFIEADLLGAGHYYARDAAANSKQAAGGEVMRRRLKRVTEELGSLSTSLPLTWDSSILLAVHADRLDVLRALLLPHPDTPYGGGSFCFDILLPPEYPDKPPKVRRSRIHFLLLRS
jgi:baculoviral IAP repeat-containing protein 6